MWLTYGSRRRARVREAVSRDLGHAIENIRLRSMLGGGGGVAAAPLLLLNNEVTGAGAGVGYSGSKVVGVGQDRRGEPSEHTGGVLATRPMLGMGERWRESSGRVGGNSSKESRPRGEGIECDRAQSSFGGGRGVLWANIEAWGGAELARHRAGCGEQARPNSSEAKLATVRRE
jgi:hypothetical protein